MGKRRIEIQKIEDRKKRNVSFTKRRQGLFKKAAELCRLTVLVLVGRAILLPPKPAKDAEKSFSCLSLLGSILPIYYKEVIAELKAAGASWIQFDEPKLVMHLDTGKLNAFTDADSQLKSTLSEYVLNRRVFTYDYVTESIAPHLGLDDPTNISLTPHNYCSQQPIAQAIKYQGFDHLSEILSFTDLDFQAKILGEEKNLGPRDCLVYVYHFIEDASEIQKCSVVRL
ncbi:hypothetical protein C5167_001963 [Papaver somniferum]|uniref:MADS-box domain-containing protein n=1 Tax=Papaver somniferum TaxID=3469 RepID=A0A4Y7L0T4_PAPSO|nr:hypothetical protein C5167_001963 [Papaver somniferum]